MADMVDVKPPLPLGGPAGLVRWSPVVSSVGSVVPLSPPSSHAVGPSPFLSVQQQQHNNNKEQKSFCGWTNAGAVGKEPKMYQEKLE